MKRLWRWLKSRMWLRNRKVISELLERNDILQQRTFELEEERRNLVDRLEQKEADLNKLANNMVKLVKSTRSDIDEALELGERQERQIQALKERLMNEEELAKAVITNSRKIHEVWKSDIMIEGAKQGSITAKVDEGQTQ